MYFKNPQLTTTHAPYARKRRVDSAVFVSVLRIPDARISRHGGRCVQRVLTYYYYYCYTRITIPAAATFTRAKTGIGALVSVGARVANPRAYAETLMTNISSSRSLCCRAKGTRASHSRSRR